MDYILITGLTKASEYNMITGYITYMTETPEYDGHKALLIILGTPCTFTLCISQINSKAYKLKIQSFAHTNVVMLRLYSDPNLSSVS